MMEIQVKVHWCPKYQLDVRFTGGDLTRYRSCSLAVFGGGVYSRPYVDGETLDSAIQCTDYMNSVQVGLKVLWVGFSIRDRLQEEDSQNEQEELQDEVREPLVR